MRQNRCILSRDYGLDRGARLFASFGLWLPVDRGQPATNPADPLLGPNRGRGCDREEKRTMAETRDPQDGVAGALWAHT